MWLAEEVEGVVEVARIGQAHGRQNDRPEILNGFSPFSSFLIFHLEEYEVGFLA